MSQIKVNYVDHMGTDLTVVNSARVSFGGTKDKLDEKDKKLIKFLADNKHMSPFEHCQLSVKITCPLYIRSQIHRHRTFAYNEISRRYTDKDISFYLPETYRTQHKSNKQASAENLDKLLSDTLLQETNLHHEQSLTFYNKLLQAGVCKEQARGILPQNLSTDFFMTGNLRNWAHFLSLRDKPDAQGEVQEVAQQVKAIVLDKFGYSAEVLLDKKEE